MILIKNMIFADKVTKYSERCKLVKALKCAWWKLSNQF